MEKTPILRKKQPRLQISKRNVSTSESPHTPIKVKKQKYSNDTDYNDNNSSTDNSVYKTPCRQILNRYENNESVNNNDNNSSFSPSSHMFLSQEPTTQDVGWGKECQTPPPFLKIKSEEFVTKFKNFHENKRIELQPIKELPKVGTPKGFKKFLKDYEKHRECQLKSRNLNLFSTEPDSAFKENININFTKDCTFNNKYNNIKCNITTKSPNFKEIDDDFDILSNIDILSKIDNIIQTSSTKIVETSKDVNKIKTKLDTNIAESNEIIDLLDDSDSDVLLEASQQIELIVSKKDTPPPKDELEKKCNNRKSLNVLFQDSFDEALLSLENNDIDSEILKTAASSNNTGTDKNDNRCNNSSTRNIFSRYNSMPTESPQKPKPTHQLKRHPSTSSISTSSGVSNTSSNDKNGIIERKMIAMQRLAKTKQRQQFNGGSGRNPNILFTNKK